jgi:hypothetical protein
LEQIIDGIGVHPIHGSMDAILRLPPHGVIAVDPVIKRNRKTRRMSRPEPAQAGSAIMLLVDIDQPRRHIPALSFWKLFGVGF